LALTLATISSSDTAAAKRATVAKAIFMMSVFNPTTFLNQKQLVSAQVVTTLTWVQVMVAILTAWHLVRTMSLHQSSIRHVQVIWVPHNAKVLAQTPSTLAATRQTRSRLSLHTVYKVKKTSCKS